MKKFLDWARSLLAGMGDALFHPYKDNQPPQIGYQPFSDKPYKRKRAVI